MFKWFIDWLNNLYVYLFIELLNVSGIFRMCIILYKCNGEWWGSYSIVFVFKGFEKYLSIIKRLVIDLYYSVDEF